MFRTYRYCRTAPMDAAITAALGFLVAVAWVGGAAIVLALTVTVLAVQLAAA